MAEDKLTLSERLFGKKLAEIPCYRTSLMSGLGGGIGIAFASFMASSDVSKSTKRGFSSYVLITAAVWTWCRYTSTQRTFDERKFKQLVKEKLRTEGTEIERKLEREGKDI